MPKHKRGKLREVRIRPMYDEKEKPTGYTVHAEHEPAPSKDGKESSGYSYVPPIESPHETHESALAKAKEHLQKAAGEEPDYDDGEDEEQKPLRGAFGRPKRR